MEHIGVCRVHVIPNVPHPGMTLRDWFAGQAIGHTIEIVSVLDDYKYGLLAHHANAKTKEECYARCAYAVADAMIAEKRRTEGGVA